MPGWWGSRYFGVYKISVRSNTMPRSLSGLKTGDFDTLEVSDKITAQDLETQGQFTHTGPTLQFATLKVGSSPAAPSTPNVMNIDGGLSYGAISCRWRGSGCSSCLTSWTSCASGS